MQIKYEFLTINLFNYIYNEHIYFKKIINE